MPDALSRYPGAELRQEGIEDLDVDEREFKARRHGFKVSNPMYASTSGILETLPRATVVSLPGQLCMMTGLLEPSKVLWMQQGHWAILEDYLRTMEVEGDVED